MLNSVLADNADAILLVDADGVIAVANQAARDLFGRDTLVGRSFGHPVAGDRTQIELLRGAETLVVEMHVNATNWEGEPYKVATLRDVTAQVKAEQALRDFVSMASHEFRTPLTAIGGFATTIVDHLETLDSETLHRYASIIVDQTDRLSRLASDLLAMSRLDGGQLPVYEEDVPVRATVVNAVRSVARHLDVEIDVPEDLVVRADADHIRDMVTNYLANAVKYGREPVAVRAEVVGSLLEVRVVDHGDGVPEDFRPRLFERFTRARNEQTRAQVGTGLGLSIVKGLARIQGGDAWYEPHEPNGSRFCFSVRIDGTAEEGEADEDPQAG